MMKLHDRIGEIYENILTKRNSNVIIVKRFNY